MAKMGPVKADRGAQAIAAFEEAERFDARPRVQFGQDVEFRHAAERQRALGEELLQPAGAFVEGCGEAVDSQPYAKDPDWVVEDFANTLQRPNSVSVAASEARLRALRTLNVLNAGVDAGVTAKAANSIERMLSHQMAVAHFQALKLLESSEQERLQTVDRVRLVNAAARLLDVYQTAALTLQKLKAKGQQRVIVQYQQVNVGEGGRAVVATTVRGGLRRKGRGSGQNRG